MQSEPFVPLCFNFIQSGNVGSFVWQERKDGICSLQQNLVLEAQGWLDILQSLQGRAYCWVPILCQQRIWDWF